jgi:hypothetical protein
MDPKIPFCEDLLNFDQNLPSKYKIYEDVEERWSRKHGLQWPLHPQQAFAFLYLSMNCAICILLCHSRPTPLTLLLLSSLLVLFHTLRASICDPTDPLIYYQRLNQKKDDLITQVR